MFDWMSTDAQSQGAARPAVCDTPQIVTQGILAGTRVASNLGWRVAEALAPGDKVLTFDNGMQTVQEVRREVIWMEDDSVPKQHWPVHVPAGALCNRVALSILPDQGVVVESDVADDAFEDPFAVIAARELVGLRGIAQAPLSFQQEVVTIIFEDEQVIYAEGGALIHCPKSVDLFDQRSLLTKSTYAILSPELAALVVDELRLEDALSRSGSKEAAVAA